MFSQLSRGYGSWVAGYVDPLYGEKKHPEREYTLPDIDQDTHHHGVTVGSRSGRSTAMSYATTKRTKDTNPDNAHIPKTYTTRKGALQLYVAPDVSDDSEEEDAQDRYPLQPKYAQIRRPAGQELIDLSLKLGTMGRLAMSVLNFGDEDYDKEHASITDAKNKAFLKFLRSIDDQRIQDPYIDESLRPGGDLNTYLRELRSSSSMRNYGSSSTYVPKNREFLELQALLRGLDNNSWPLNYQNDGMSDRLSSGQFTRPVSRVSSTGGTPGPPSTPKSSHKVLSSKQLTASLKSANYLGRPASQFSVNDDDDDIQSETDYSLRNVTSAGMGKLPWTPEGSSDGLLIDKYFKGSSEDWETDPKDGNKRRKLKERSYLTGSEVLYQGRNSQKGEGHQNELKFNGEGHTPSKGQTMNQITEEASEVNRFDLGDEEEEMSEEESEVTGQWAEHVTRVQQTVTKIKPPSPVQDLSDHGDVNKMSPRLVDVNVPQVPDSDRASKRLRPRSNTSNSSRSSRSSRSSISSLKNVPTVVSLQSAKAQPKPPEKNNGLLFKRRKSLSAALAFDPEKLKNAIQGPRSRPKSSHAESTRPFMLKTETTETTKPTARQYASHYTFKPTAVHWSTGGVESPNNQPEMSDEAGAIDDNKVMIDQTLYEESQYNESNFDASQGEGRTEGSEIYHDYDDGIIQEDALLKDIVVCNEEVEQIEANADTVDTDSDSGTYVDEEIMRELIEAEENEKEMQMSGQEFGMNRQVEMKVADDDNDDDEGGDVEEKQDSLVEADVNEEVDGDVTEMPAEIIEKGDVDTEQVDEVHDEHSDVHSKSTGRKLRSKLSSKLSSADGESNDTTTEYEDVLSEFRKDTGHQDLTQPGTDNQTAFSGSTGSYSDLLANDKQPETLSEGPDVDSGSAEQDVMKDNVSEVIETADNLNSEATDSEQNVTVDAKEKDSGKTENLQDTIKSSQNDGSNLDQDQIGDKTDERSEQQVESTVEGGEGKDEQNDLEINVVIKDKSEEIETKQQEQVTESVNDTVNADSNATQTIVKEESDTGKAENAEQHTADNNKTEIDNKTTAEVNPPEPAKQTVQPTSSKTAPQKAPIKRVDSRTSRGNVRKPVNAKVDRTKPTLQHAKTVAALDTRKVAVEASAEPLSKLDDIGEGAAGTEGDVLNEGQELGTSSITDELESLGLGKALTSSSTKKKGKKTDYPLVPPGKRPKAPPEKMKIPDHLKEAMDRKTMQSYENLEKDLEKMTALVDESLSGPTLEAVGEGLTEEELEMAKQILERKIEEAKQQLDGKDIKGKGQKKKPPAKGQKKGGKKRKDEEEKTEEELQREAIKEKQAIEKKRRDEEVKELQRKIAERKKLLQDQDDAASAKAKELREQMEKLEQEADDLQRAEDEARDILSEVRKKQREERDARRKADSERRKQDALDRREREKKELEDKKRKEMEMMEKIADAEMRRRLREEEERKMYEEERLAQERYEEELREAQRMEEEEEERMRELERQAEEEAMQRLIDEREAAERQRRRLMEEEDIMREEERVKREYMMKEEERLAAERNKLEEAEQMKRQREMDRLMELRRAEEEARQKLQEELEKRRSDALGRRDFNIENKQNIDKLRHHQGITRAWTFSYFVKWPRETYERPIGAGDPRKIVKINNPAPKKVEPIPENPDNPAEPPAP